MVQRKLYTCNFQKGNLAMLILIGTLRLKFTKLKLYIKPEITLYYEYNKTINILTFALDCFTISELLNRML